MVVSGCTILSSLLSDRMTRKMGAGLVTALSVLMTAAALFGFSISSEAVDADRMVYSLRPGRGRGGRRPEQLRGAALFLPAHELAALHVGRRGRPSAPSS